MWAHCWIGGRPGDNTEKAEVLNTFFTAIFTEKICLWQSQVPEMHWKFGTRKTYPRWKKIRLHSLFCGCNHWWKMQCSFITKGPFIRILSQQQQDTQVFYRNGLFQFSAFHWKTLTWIVIIPYPTHAVRVLGNCSNSCSLSERKS